MKRLWTVLVVVTLFGFVVLGWVGTRIYQEMPPIPDRVVTTDGQVVIASGEIARGQSVWQAMGGMEVGSIWGHGSYVAPDWTADWLHRECDVHAQRLVDIAVWHALRLGSTPEQQAALRERLKQLVRTNTFDAANKHVCRSIRSGEGLRGKLKHYYADVFSQRQSRVRDPAGRADRPVEACASLALSSSGPRGRRRLIDRATRSATRATGLTSRWSATVATGEAVVWTGVSIMMLLAGIGGFVWYYAAPASRSNGRAGVRQPIRSSDGRPLLRRRLPSSTLWSWPL